MSKFEKVKEQFPSVNNATLQKLYNEDWTPSKKYFPFMVKIWCNKKTTYEGFTSPTLIKTMKKFDELLPYITNKDVYSASYTTLKSVQKEIENAELIKEEKTFVREEHVSVIEETKEYIFLSPKTYRGSLKYGANTRWCTASKNDEYTFNRYNKTGFLAYLISKGEKNGSKFNKIAFWTEDAESPLSCEIMIYDSTDSLQNDAALIAAEWNIETLFKLFMKFRQYAYTKFRLSKAENNVKRKLSVIQSLSFQQLHDDMTIIRDWQSQLYAENVFFDYQAADEIIKNFLDGINKQLV
jgi:hypothetical protein